MSDQTPTVVIDANGNPVIPPVTNGYADLLSAITNSEGKPKYDTPEKALEALKHSQEYIPQLKQTLAEKEAKIAELEAQNKRIADLDGVLERLTRTEQQVSTPTDTKVSLEEIQTLVNSSLTAREQVAKQEGNAKLVVDTLHAKYGEAALTKLKETAAANGMSEAEALQFCKTHPQLVLNLFPEIKQQKMQPNLSGTTVNLQALQPNTDTTIRRNTEGVLLGSTQDKRALELKQSKAMIEELAASGKTIFDMQKPSEYFKHFK
jgi:hypothetical protein